MLSIRLSHMFSMSYYFFSIRRACSVLLSSFVPPGRTYRTQPAAASETPDQLAERLLTTYGNSILRLAYAYLHNMADAEEILQETLLQFFQKPPALESQEHEKAWLLRVAGNLSKNRLAYNKVRAADELSDTLAAEQREDLSFVWDAVKSLPVKYREAIHLFYYEGYSTAQIAQILEQNESTVRSHLNRGRSLLKDVLKEAYDFGKDV